MSLLVDYVVTNSNPAYRLGGNACLEHSIVSGIRSAMYLKSRHLPSLCKWINLYQREKASSKITQLIQHIPNTRVNNSFSLAGSSYFTSISVLKQFSILNVPRLSQKMLNLVSLTKKMRNPMRISYSIKSSALEETILVLISLIKCPLLMDEKIKVQRGYGKLAAE